MAGLAVQVAGLAGAVQIVLDIVLLVGALADIADIAVGADVTHEPQPAFAGSRCGGSLLKPPVFDTPD